MSIESDMHLTFEVPGKLEVWLEDGLYIRVVLRCGETLYPALRIFEPSELRALPRMLNKMIKRIEENQK